MKKFTELDIQPELMRAIADLKYEIPSAIQAQALPILLGKATDFIGLAATGTGKTAAFAIPMLERINASKRTPQALVLCPTRELAMQVSGQINLLGKYLNIRSLPIYGGAGFDTQLRGLRDGVNVIVGTPGRLVDHLKRGTLKLGDLKTLILDEADEMISMGFKDDLEAILKAMPRATGNIWLFSATMNREVRRVADTYLKNPALVQINKKEMLSNTVEQLYYMTKESSKPEVLCKLIDAADNFYGIIFCQTKLLVVDLTRYLTDRGYKVDCLHGDKDQKSREKTMQLFRDRRVSLLICTDVASRGLDVKDITHVINYSIPRELDNYVHRIGRTARSGKSGIAMSLVSPSHRMLIGRIEKMTNSRMKEGLIPTHKEIMIKKVNQVLANFKTQKSTTRALEVMGSNWKTEISELSKEEIIARFLVMNFPDVLSNVDTTQHHALMGDDPYREERREHRDERSSFRRDDNRKPWAKKPAADNHPHRVHAPAAHKPHAATSSKPHAVAATQSKAQVGKAYAAAKGKHTTKPSHFNKPKRRNEKPERRP
jgi:ATP-dependent RNA helicase DeaD